MLPLSGLPVARGISYAGPGLPLRRLFSTFATGWPGAGLLLMRAVAGSASMAHGITVLLGRSTMEAFALNLLAAGVGLLLLAGLWTPVAGGMLALVELWLALLHWGDPSVHLLLGTLGVALALIGPGAWSADARIFGWRRIDIPTPKG